MKKAIFLSCLAMALCFSAVARDFTPFRVDAGLGYAVPFNDGFSGGMLFYVEPKFEVIPQVSVGLRWEGSLFGGGDAEGGSIRISSGYMLTGDYHINNNAFRPFVGMGLGTFVMGEIGTDAGAYAGTNFATMLRAGFDVSHFRLTASYNMAFASEMFHYFAITAGFYIGGGRR